MEILCPVLPNISIKQHPFYSKHLDVSEGTIYCASCWSINIYSAQLTSDLYSSTDNNATLFIHIEFSSFFFCFYCENITQFTIVINMRQRNVNAKYPHLLSCIWTLILLVWPLIFMLWTSSSIWSWFQSQL